MPIAYTCPKHGALPSKSYRSRSSQGVYISDNTEPCAVCKRPSRVIEGLYDFDENAYATALVAPNWSVAALDIVQEKLRGLLRTVENESIPDETVALWVERTLDDIVDLDPTPANRQFAEGVRRHVQGRPRSVIKRVLMGASLAIGVTLSGMTAVNTVATFTDNASSFVTSVIEQAEGEPRTIPSPQPAEVSPVPDVQLPLPAAEDAGD